MEKSNNSFGDVEGYFCEPPNFGLKFFPGPPAKGLVIYGKRAGVESAG